MPPLARVRQKLGGAKRRLVNAKRALLPPKFVAGEQSNENRAREITRRTVEPSKLAIEACTATERIHSRLSADDLAEIARRAGTDDAGVPLPVPPGAPPQTVTVHESWKSAGGTERKRIELMLGARYEIPGVLEKTRVSTAMPPEEVHAMSHSPLSAGGSFYHADLVADALASVGAPLREGDHGLDFGCSSGRVVRALAAAYPEVSWAGCDPNGDAVKWAAENLPAIEFFNSPHEPPLPYADDRFAVAFGISIWSHYAERLALLWYDEMWRVLRPGGHLISTTHGPQSVAFYGDLGLRSAEQLAEIREQLYETGYWYAPEFGYKGDWGVVNDEWGTSFLSPEWMLDKLCPKWEVVEYGRARNENNQDVYVLRKPPAAV